MTMVYDPIPFVVTEYTLARASGPDEFIAKCNELIALGWRPHGSPITTTRGERFLFIQAMVR